MQNFQKIISEYGKDYCLFLEAAYGKDMLSEGGSTAVDRMFKGMDLSQKKLLDVGCGLGGVAFDLAKRYDACVTGLELNPWFVTEATKRTPANLKSKVNFIAYETPPVIPLKSQSIDLVYSKGVLTHVEDKLPLFNEFKRVLKPGGRLVIDDWLSLHKGRWGARLQKMCEMEDLTLFAETEQDYIDVLTQSGFKEIVMRDENHAYAGYNNAVVMHLSQVETKTSFIKTFGEAAWQEAIEAYQMIADSIKDSELLIRNIKAHI